MDVIPFERLLDLPRQSTELWVTPSVRARVADALPYHVGTPTDPAEGTERVVCIGGGSLLDVAKAWRADRSPTTHLIAIPSVWGSGAEVSPIVVLNEGGKKAIRMDDRFLPDEVAYWPDLAEGLANDVARAGCGDAWSHALEGFLSPLATEQLRAEIAALMHRMVACGIGNEPTWFQLSAEACVAQSRSSVGLVHGIAHTLEGPLRAQASHVGWGHAKLCSLFLWPVMAFDLEGDKATSLLETHGVDRDAVFRVAQQLHESEAYRAVLPLLTERWRTVLRDQCTRTNVRLVRPKDLAFFEAWSAT